MPEPDDHVVRNRAAWDRQAPDYAPEGRPAWAAAGPDWRIWHVPGAQVRVVPDPRAPDLEADGPAGDRLVRDSFGMHRFEWSDDPAIEFHLGHGDWVRLLRANGFDVEDLIEIRPPEGATTRYPFVTLEWSRRWPCEEVWKARLARE